MKRGSKGRSGLNTSWAAVEDSVVVVAYVGPVRALDATLLGDSVYMAIRSYDLGLAGPLPESEGPGARGLCYLARPWQFGRTWVREAIERGSVEPAGDGWRIRASLDGAEGPLPCILDLNRSCEPVTLRIRRAADPEPWITVRFGPIRRFRIGRTPRWIEWSHGDTRIRLDIEQQEMAKPSQMRHPPPPSDDWTMVALDDPRGRDVLRRLFGVDAGEEGR